MDLAQFLAIQKKVSDVQEQIKYVAVYASLAVVAVGLVGNIMALIVFSRKSLRNTSSGTYFRALIIIDLMFLILGAMPDLALIGIEELMGDKVGAWLCKCWTFAFRTLQGLSSWVLVATAVDTYFLLQTPERSASRNSLFKARVSVVCLSVISIVLNLWVLWGISDMGMNAIIGSIRVDHCGYSSLNYLDFDVNYNEYIVLVLHSALPAFLLLLLTVPILNRIIRPQRADLVLQERGKASGVMILCGTFTFILMEAPNVAMGALFWSEVLMPYSQDPIATVWRFFVKSILIFFGYSHHSLKFYLFCIASSNFRNDVRNMCNDGDIRFSNDLYNGTSEKIGNNADCDKDEGEAVTMKKNNSNDDGEGMARF